MERPIEEVAETLKAGKRHNPNRKCTLLIGAGCSVSAGIPTANGFVKFIKDKYPSYYERAVKKDYPSLMNELGENISKDLVSYFVDNAQLNWAHIAIAQLIHAGYVDRVLTTNFDPLVVRACALVDVYPAVYDLAASQMFKEAQLPDKAIFYLHGQRDGFKLLHDNNEQKELKSQLNQSLKAPGAAAAGSWSVTAGKMTLSLSISKRSIVLITTSIGCPIKTIPPANM